jgi:hypothetical protein
LKDEKGGVQKDEKGEVVTRARRYEKAAFGALPNEGARRALLDGPECPPELFWLWELYCDLARGRSIGFDGRHLTWESLAAWLRLRNIQLTQFEIDVLFDLDSVQPLSTGPDDDD